MASMMITPADSELGASVSPRSFAIAHQRPRSSFLGCSKIGDYEILGKLGEGTFGYVDRLVPSRLSNFADCLWNREVHRARSNKTGALVALKKIIMHNEKDGVRMVTLDIHDWY